MGLTSNRARLCCVGVLFLTPRLDGRSSHEGLSLAIGIVLLYTCVMLRPAY